MNWAIWTVFGMAGAVLLLSAWVAGSSPRFWVGMGKIVIEEGLPKLSALWKAYKAKHTPEEWEAIRKKWDTAARPNR